MVTPRFSITNCPPIRSNTWHRGRKDNTASSGPSREKISRAQVATFDPMFAWVNITPLGSPVVPEV
jgi:hypothetical protein